MRRLVNYIRQIFCKHDWITDEGYTQSELGSMDRSGMKVYMRCKKCGYHQNHWKYL